MNGPPPAAGGPAAAGMPARRAALDAITAVEVEDAYANLAVATAVDGLEHARDRSFAARLAYDTLRWQGTLDWVLERFVDRPLSEVEPALRRILRLGVLQIGWLDVPARAAVDTAVRLAREAVPRSRAKGAGGFVNGVLRAVARTLQPRGDGELPAGVPWPDPGAGPVAALALTTAHPRWVVADLLERLGPARTAAVLAADNDPPGLTLRAVGDRDTLLAELRASGLAATAGALAPEAVRVPGGDPRRIAAVAEGRARPQDEASMVVTHATGVGPGDRVLDLCAGPGGKATHLAELVGPRGGVVAVEIHPHRAKLIRDTADRLDVAVDVRVGDATAPPVDPDEGFDAVLIDAPCTGLGTGRRRPDVRWRREASDVDDTAALQLSLLTAAAPHVRPGGRLVYAVCTWTADETAGVVTRFEATTAASAFAPATTRQLWPDEHDTDGMFIAVFERAGADVPG